jgi:hypothetical protein
MRSRTACTAALVGDTVLRIIEVGAGGLGVASRSPRFSANSCKCLSRIARWFSSARQAGCAVIVISALSYPPPVGDAPLATYSILVSGFQTFEGHDGKGNHQIGLVAVRPSSARQLPGGQGKGTGPRRSGEEQGSTAPRLWHALDLRSEWVARTCILLPMGIGRLWERSSSRSTNA